MANLRTTDLIAMHLGLFYDQMVKGDPWRKRCYDMIECIADALEEDNPEFDRKRFVDAATGEVDPTPIVPAVDEMSEMEFHAG